MVDLTPLTPCAGLLPATQEDLTLYEVDPGPITALMPFRGRAGALSAALSAAHGVAFPAPGRSATQGAVSCLWTGRGQAFLMGADPDPTLADHASVTDQSDAWAVVHLSGQGADEVLARLVPLDLRPAAFPEGAAARTLCQHMTVLVLRRPEAFEILAFRSMARTLAHELAQAMAAVAARRAAG